MSTTADLITHLKAELKAAGITYAMLARQLGMAESSVKRMFGSGGDMPVSRIDDICRVLKLDFADLARRVADTAPLMLELTLAQEKAVVADRTLLVVAICVMSQMPADEIIATYDLTEAKLVKALAQLDRIGIIELRPGNRYRLKLAKGFRWLPHGPVMEFFRKEVLDDYFVRPAGASVNLTIVGVTREPDDATGGRTILGGAWLVAGSDTRSGFRRATSASAVASKT